MTGDVPDQQLHKLPWDHTNAIRALTILTVKADGSTWDRTLLSKCPMHNIIHGGMAVVVTLTQPTAETMCDKTVPLRIVNFEISW